MMRCPKCDREFTENDFWSYNNDVVWFRCRVCATESSSEILTDPQSSVHTPIYTTGGEDEKTNKAESQI